MSLSKKHYQEIARILRANASYTSDKASAEWLGVCQELADYFQQDNRAFDIEKFLLACGFYNQLEEIDDADCGTT